MASGLKLLLSRYKQFGGLRVVRQYARMGVLWPTIKMVLRNPFSRQNYKKAYASLVEKVSPYLQDIFAPMMPERKAYYQSLALEKKRSNIVWFCWLQGIDNAPDIVKACYRSIKLNLKDREVRLVDGNNWKDYVEMPDYILEKWHKKQIPPALFADLLRLQLLISYGGTWMDSTILCTGLTPENEEYTRPYLDADLFMFQYTRPGSPEWGGIGNWFITSCTNNEVLLVLRDMLFDYWKKFDCTLNYYIFHLFFSMLRDVFPEEIAAMPYGYCIPGITLVYHWAEKFKQEKWDKFTSKVCFHKLAYNIKQPVLDDRENYYHFILDKYLQPIATSDPLVP